MNNEDNDIINAHLAGATQKEIGERFGLAQTTVSQRLRKDTVQEEIRRRINALAERVLKFKLKAFDGAEQGLDKLIEINGSTGTTKELQRLTSIDLIKIGGMWPRKRILVEGNVSHGIDEDTMEFLKQVQREAGIIDAEP